MPRRTTSDMSRRAAAIALAISTGIAAPAALAQDGNKASSPCAPKAKKAASCGPSRPCGPKAKKAAPCGPSAPCAPKKKAQ